MTIKSWIRSFFLIGAILIISLSQGKSEEQTEGIAVENQEAQVVVQEPSIASIEESNVEVPTDDKSKEIADAVLPRDSVTQLAFAIPEVKASSVTSIDVAKEKPMVSNMRFAVPMANFAVQENMGDKMFWYGSWFIPVLLVLFIWFRSRGSVNRKFKQFSLELRKKEKCLVHEVDIRRAVEEVLLQKDKEAENLADVVSSLKLEVQEKNKSLSEGKKISNLMGEELSKDEVDLDLLVNHFSDLKEKLKRKRFNSSIGNVTSFSGKKIDKKEGDADACGQKDSSKQSSYKEKRKIVERRIPVRMPLTKDFNNTIILNVNAENAPQSIKCFAKDISAGGLCFETKEKFLKNTPVNLRLFFYGKRVPIIKAKGYIVWKKTVSGMNYYGVAFNKVEDKDRVELNSYIASRV
jgi:hypothetical protein